MNRDGGNADRIVLSTERNRLDLAFAPFGFEPLKDAEHWMQIFNG